MTDFAIIDTGGRVWGPYTCAHHMARCLGMHLWAISGRLRRPDFNVRKLRSPFIAVPWRGRVLDEYGLPPIGEWRRGAPGPLSDLRQRLSRYTDPYAMPRKSEDPRQANFAIIDYGGRVWGPFSHRRRFEQHFGLSEGLIRGIIYHRSNHCRLQYTRLRPFLIVHADHVDDALPLTPPGRGWFTTPEIEAMIENDLRGFREKIRRYIHESAPDADPEAAVEWYCRRPRPKSQRL